MGGSGSLVDGVRRWFQRRRLIPSSNQQNNKIIIDHHDTSSSSSTTLTLTQKQSQESTADIVVQDFDFSSLRLVKVPKRHYFLDSSMDSHKKLRKSGLDLDPQTQHRW
ncbi:hypothetical protein E1A91_D12G075500v1 [Gossypium mustelinum]|uniref:Uncharacterized protein n=2 Tax=Gossypium TaxID=3633 RepID=A0A5D2SBR9_GOSMU|nr:hypothetical protein ES288_D12G077900v1 [Gossypium darwinii]TYI50052.1 hypothetical protein E1A91_D12G075500v1 [Gossypium mustelinum]